MTANITLYHSLCRFSRLQIRRQKSTARYITSRATHLVELTRSANMGAVPFGHGMFLLLLFLGISYLSTTHGRVLVRPSTTALSRYDDEFSGDVQTYDLLDTDSKSQIDTNVTSLDHGIDDISSYITSKRLHRRAGKQPPPATDSQFTASAAKGCSMLYMLAASGEDALTRMKTNPKLLSLVSSQSNWDNTEALEQYGWTEKQNDVNWAYMGVNDVMKDLGIDTASKANSNVQLVQDQAVEADGTKFVVSLTGERLPSAGNDRKTNIRNRHRKEPTTRPSMSKPAS
jgi:hypothetical protein